MTDFFEEICEPNSSYKTGSIREGCPFFINMLKVLSTDNVGLFLNTFIFERLFKQYFFYGFSMYELHFLLFS